VAQIAVRIGAGPETGVSASVLAFEADMAGLGSDEVLGAVDPLMMAPPSAGCALQAVDEVALRLAQDAGWLELSAFTDVSVALGDNPESLRPAPVVFPDLSDAVFGVVGEVGPTKINTVPAEIHWQMGQQAFTLPLPDMPTLIGPHGGPIPGRARVSQRVPLSLQVEGAAGSFVEVRPFGATSWLSCAVEAQVGAPDNRDGVVTITADDLQTLAQLAGSAPVSLEVVWRTSVAADSATSVPIADTKLLVEMRRSVLVELIP